MKAKIAMFCNVEKDAVITAKDVETIYEVPIVFRKEGLDELIVRQLKLQTGPPNLREWDAMVQKIKHPKHEIAVALVGKYAGLKECYKSLSEALVHGGIDHETRVNINWIESEDIERQGTERILREADGILIPGGFGSRGIEGKITTIRYARERQIPFLGLCLGMQCATIEFARNVAGLTGANSAEFDERSPYPVIHLMHDQHSVSEKGGTMRLGSYLCKLGEGTLAHKMYGENEVRERHRHRYEFNNAYREQLMAKGLMLSGLSPDGRLVEIIELRDHPWFLATQFHPEYCSRPHRPHPLFSGFVGAALRKKLGH
jgi:CTP synthase